MAETRITSDSDAGVLISMVCEWLETHPTVITLPPKLYRQYKRDGYGDSERTCAELARKMCNDLLDAAMVDGNGACGLCGG